jgi:hypothetical protein
LRLQLTTSQILKYLFSSRTCRRHINEYNIYSNIYDNNSSIDVSIDSHGIQIREHWEAK